MSAPALGRASRRLAAFHWTEDIAKLPASEPPPEIDVPDHDWDATWYKVRDAYLGNFQNVGPRGNLSDMQRTEWIAGNIIGGAEMCGYYGKPIQIRAFMSKSLYFMKGYDMIRGLDGISNCREYLKPLKEIIEQKDLWWKYLTAAYPD